jgi:hypothetical protein
MSSSPLRVTFCALSICSLPMWSGQSRSRWTGRTGDWATIVAGTVVIHEIQEQGDSFWYARQDTGATLVPVEAIGAMTAQEFQLVETFLNRRLDLPFEQRVLTATNIAERIGLRLNVPPGDRPSHDDVLEELSRRYRDNARFR